jgi:hypothetical protein
MILVVILALATSLAIAAVIDFLLPQWKLIASLLFCLLGTACAAKIGSAFDYRRWPGFRKVTAVLFLMLTLAPISGMLFSDAVLPAGMNQSTTRLLSGIPILFMSLVFDVARRRSRR